MDSTQRVSQINRLSPARRTRPAPPRPAPAPARTPRSCTSCSTRHLQQRPESRVPSAMPRLLGGRRDVRPTGCRRPERRQRSHPGRDRVALRLGAVRVDGLDQIQQLVLRLVGPRVPPIRPAVHNVSYQGRSGAPGLLCQSIPPIALPPRAANFNAHPLALQDRSAPRCRLWFVLFSISQSSISCSMMNSGWSSCTTCSSKGTEVRKPAGSVVRLPCRYRQSGFRIDGQSGSTGTGRLGELVPLTVASLRPPARPPPRSISRRA